MRRRDACSVVVLDRRGYRDPCVPTHLVHRARGRREPRLGERAYGDRDDVLLSRQVVEDRRAAMRAEVERPRVALVGDPRVCRRVPLDPDAVAEVPRLNAERASRPSLAGEAVAHRDADRISLRHQAELATATSAWWSRTFASVRSSDGARVVHESARGLVQIALMMRKIVAPTVGGLQLSEPC